MYQGSLFGADLPIFTVPPAAVSIDDQFEAFHLVNPWVYRALVTLTADMVRRGHRRVGMKMLFEVLRWQYQLATDDPSSEFALNNNFTSRYARLIMEQEPELRYVFELRALRGAA